jgi:hypothetical protein
MGGCVFTDASMFTVDEAIADSCPLLKQQAIDLINSTKPDVVIMSNTYRNKFLSGSRRQMTSDEWSGSIAKYVDAFRQSTDAVVFLAAPPADKNIKECYERKSSVPADCISEVEDSWRSIARSEQNAAKSVGGTWIDSRPWFCNEAGLCPTFAGSTPTKLDTVHMTLAYGEKIYPVMGESLESAGVL